MREDFWVGGDVFIRWWVIDGQPGQYMATMVNNPSKQQSTANWALSRWSKLLYDDIIERRLHPFEG